MIQSSSCLVYGSVARIVLPLAAFAAGWAAQPGGAETLETGKTVEARLTASEPREYRVPLRKGQYAKLSFDQRTIKATLAILRPGREPLFEIFNAPIGAKAGAEVVASEPGEWIAVVTAGDPKLPPGNFALTLEEVAEATPVHIERAAGSELQSRGASAWRKGGKSGIAEAVGLYERAAGHWRRAGDKGSEAVTLCAAAKALAEAGDKEKALRYASESVSAAKTSGNDEVMGWSLQVLGYIHNNFSDKRKAVEYLEQALPLMRKAGSRLGEGEIHNDLAISYWGMGDLRKSLDNLRAAAAIMAELQENSKLATIYSNIGVIHSDLGEFDKSLEHQRRSLVLKAQTGDRSGEATSLNNLGSTYSSMADYQKALDSYLSALEIHRELGRDWSVAVCLHNIAWVHATLGDRKRAIGLYEEALAILRKIEDQRGMSNTLNNLGENWFALGNREKALAHLGEALALRRAVGDRKGEAVSLGNIAKVHAAAGRKQQARENVDLAVKLLRQGDGPRTMAGALLTSAALWRQTRDFENASGDLSEALSIGRRIQDRRLEADVLGEFARVERDRGNHTEALRRASEALKALEALRLTIASPSLRAWFFALKHDIHEMEIELLVRMHAEHPDGGFAAAALLAAERSKARSLLELLGESSAGIRRGVDAKFLDRERELERRIFAKAEHQTRLLNGKPDPAAASAAAKELAALTAEFEHVQSQIRSTSPGYAALTRPEPLCPDEIQRTVLDVDTVLLEFSLGAEKSFLWAATKSSMDVFTLPARPEIEAGVRRVHELLTVRNRTVANETPTARAARIRQADAAYLPAAANLSRMLFGEAAPRMAGKRLLIVADGALQYLPFSALPDPSEPGAKPAPLIVNHEIVTAPSASVLAAMRNTFAGRKHASKTLAVFADPVFGTADGRVIRGSGETREGPVDREFFRLRFSRTEADEIARFAPPDLTLKALDFDANRDAVLGEDLGQYRILHFATHAVLDNEHPELSGVVLSRVDRLGQPRNGFLRLYDIYNLRLGSDLVVLSACETALGGEISGEGLIGLTRGFVYAGAPRVVATLWKVDDRPTAEIMKLFYEGMLGRGETPAAALRSAQTAMWKSRGWDAPYRWAAFTLQGEWR